MISNTQQKVGDGYHNNPFWKSTPHRTVEDVFADQIEAQPEIYDDPFFITVELLVEFLAVSGYHKIVEAFNKVNE